MNAAKLYLLFGHFAGDAILCSNLFVFYCFSVPCFFHTNDLKLNLEFCVSTCIFQINRKFYFCQNVSYDLVAFTWWVAVKNLRIPAMLRMVWSHHKWVMVQFNTWTQHWVVCVLSSKILLMSARSAAHLRIRSVKYNQGFWIYLYFRITLFCALEAGDIVCR